MRRSAVPSLPNLVAPTLAVIAALVALSASPNAALAQDAENIGMRGGLISSVVRGEGEFFAKHPWAKLELGSDSDESGLDYQLPDDEPEFLAALPWISNADRQNKRDASWYWNTHFRGGRGQAGLTAVHYHEFKVTRRSGDATISGTTNDIDNAYFQELFFGIYLQGVIYPMLQLSAEGGTMLTEVAFSNTGQRISYGFGFYYGAGVSFSPPVTHWFTPVIDFRFRGWLAQGDDATELTGFDLRGGFRLFFEIVQDVKGVSWDVYVGGAVALHQGSIEGSGWEVPTDDLTLFDIEFGTMLLFEDRGAITIGGRLPNFEIFLRLEITG